MWNHTSSSPCFFFFTTARCARKYACFSEVTWVRSSKNCSEMAFTLFMNNDYTVCNIYIYMMYSHLMDDDYSMQHKSILLLHTRIWWMMTTVCKIQVYYYILIILLHNFFFFGKLWSCLIIIFLIVSSCFVVAVGVPVWRRFRRRRAHRAMQHGHVVRAIGGRQDQCCVRVSILLIYCLLCARQGRG